MKVIKVSLINLKHFFVFHPDIVRISKIKKTRFFSSALFFVYFTESNILLEWNTQKISKQKQKI